MSISCVRKQWFPFGLSEKIFKSPSSLANGKSVWGQALWCYSMTCDSYAVLWDWNTRFRFSASSLQVPTEKPHIVVGGIASGPIDLIESRHQSVLGRFYISYLFISLVLNILGVWNIFLDVEKNAVTKHIFFFLLESSLLWCVLKWCSES